MTFGNVLKDTVETYERIIDLILPLGLLVLFVSSFLMLAATYITGGAGFVRYLDILYSSPMDGIIALIVAGMGLFAFSFLSVGVTALVKFKRTLDDVSFIKLANRAVSYSLKVSIAWFFLALASFILGVILKAFSVPDIILALVFIVMWWGAIFLPQIVVLEELPFLKALAASLRYSLKHPGQVVIYYILSLVFVGLIIVAETTLEQLPFFYWTAPFISSILLFIFVVPFLEILKCEFYLATKYRITTAGLK